MFVYVLPMDIYAYIQSQYISFFCFTIVAICAYCTIHNKCAIISQKEALPAIFLYYLNIVQVFLPLKQQVF